MQFHQGLVEELCIVLRQKGVSLEQEDAQAALTGFVGEDIQSSVRQWILDSVTEVLDAENKARIMLEWESANEGRSPFYIPQMNGD